MSRATRLINRLDKVLARHDSFGDDPAAFVDSVFAEIEEQLALVKAKSANTGLISMWSGSRPDQGTGAQPGHGPGR